MTSCAVAWGNVAEWAGAIGTLLAFGLALVLFWRQIDDRSADQASKVHVLTARNESYSVASLGASVEHEGVVKFVVTNTSDAPVYETAVALLPWDATVDSKPLRVQSFESMFPNHRTAEHQIRSTEIMRPYDADSPPESPPKRAPLSIEFLDASGRRLKRMPDGQLWHKRNDRWRRKR